MPKPSPAGLTKGRATLHEESLLHIPLVQQFLTDQQVRLEPRRIDRSWIYEKTLSLSVNGFNPFSGRVFYAAKSYLAQWLANPRGSARDYNEGDHLVREVLFAVHDYLHIWSLFAINRMHPELGLGVAPIDQQNIEDFVFCHLVTEAAATVGLDYWYLCTLDLDRLIPVGTLVRGLTTPYHEDHSHEYRRFNPTLRVQTKAFFNRLCRFYCDGVFRGFDLTDMKRSPRVYRWLMQEVSYSGRQRSYIRQWLSYLSGGTVVYGAEQLEAAVAVDADWKQRLMARVAEQLWAKVKRGDSSVVGSPIDEARVWRSPESRTPDFRFLNANVVSGAGLNSATMTPHRDGRQLLLAQFLSTFELSRLDPALRAQVPSMLESVDLSRAARLLRGQRQLPPLPEWRDLMFLN
jgi:hypothetical protein